MSDKRGSVFLKPGKEKAIKNRHPWIFSGAIARADDGIRPGDEVFIRDASGLKLAIGHWCQSQGLSCRIFSFDIDISVGELFLDRLKVARDFRKALGLPSKKTSGYRLIHGEGDELSGLVCDIFGNSASIGLENPGLLGHMKALYDFLTDSQIDNIFLADSCSGKSAWQKKGGSKGLFLENDLSFLANIENGQKTGHFLDQRDNRLLVGDLSHNRDVLDAFCYSGGFTTYALNGGANLVTSVDISKSAIALCKEHVALNRLDKGHEAVQADCFQFLRQIKRDQFDLIVLDPPAFAKSKAAVGGAARGYKDINLLALKAVRTGGLIFTFSCSQHIDPLLFKKIIFAAAKDSGREVKIIKELGQGCDHLVSIYCPQSSYLKGLLLYVL